MIHTDTFTRISKPSNSGSKSGQNALPRHPTANCASKHYGQMHTRVCTFCSTTQNEHPQFYITAWVYHYQYSAYQYIQATTLSPQDSKMNIQSYVLQPERIDYQYSAEHSTTFSLHTGWDTQTQQHPGQKKHLNDFVGANSATHWCQTPLHSPVSCTLNPPAKGSEKSPPPPRRRWTGTVCPGLGTLPPNLKFPVLPVQIHTNYFGFLVLFLRTCARK